LLIERSRLVRVDRHMITLGTPWAHQRFWIIPCDPIGSYGMLFL
jgi:hypothetical protein